jgi:hypothetical protein
MKCIAAKGFRMLAATAAFAGAGLATASVPAVSSAKGLTKGQVIRLIKQYSKPGPQGPPGPPGKNGINGTNGINGQPWTLPSNSGLTLSNNALSIDFGGLTGCGGYQFLYRLEPAGTSACRYEPTSDMYSAFAGYQAGSNGALNAPLGISIDNAGETIVTSPAVGVSGPHLVTVFIQLGSVDPGGDTDSCELDENHGSTVTPIQTEATTVNPYSTLYFQAGLAMAAGDTMSVKCTVNAPGTGHGHAGGNIFEYLANN